MKTKNEHIPVIGERIRHVRIQRKITQEALAELIGFGNGQQVSDIERDLSGFSVPKLMDICKALNVDADYLLFGNESRNVTNQSINNFLSKMTPEQIRCIEQIIAAYAKTCGIN